MTNNQPSRPARPPATTRAAAFAFAFTLTFTAIAPSAAFAQPASAARGSAAVKTESGLGYRSLRDGRGNSPTAADRVKVHYRGTLMDGTEFDSSYARGEPATFPLGGVIRCWTEGVQKMKPGGKAELTCPPQIAYGERGAGGKIPPNATLKFEVELLEVNPK